jgi:S-formylglutathione hydrolase FrmB
MPFSKCDAPSSIPLHRLSDVPLKPRVYMTIGRQDSLYDANLQFFEEMRALELDFTAEEWDGGHDWYYWDESMRRALARFDPDPDQTAL